MYLDVNSKNTLQQNYENYRDSIKMAIDKHAPIKNKDQNEKRTKHMV